MNARFSNDFPELELEIVLELLDDNFLLQKKTKFPSSIFHFISFLQNYSETLISKKKRFLRKFQCDVLLTAGIRGSQKLEEVLLKFLVACRLVCGKQLLVNF